ncbi:MAG: hypothetical protein KME16_04160 [Scytolyngbya sp. HA4215-MV1]|jgi:hypothetical protein|nr:hypothetical protein [Scytolyngbya sp. HA4215-MV1]
MKALETTATINDLGQLTLDTPLTQPNPVGFESFDSWAIRVKGARNDQRQGEGVRSQESEVRSQNGSSSGDGESASGVGYQAGAWQPELQFSKLEGVDND